MCNFSFLLGSYAVCAMCDCYFKAKQDPNWTLNKNFTDNSWRHVPFTFKQCRHYCGIGSKPWLCNPHFQRVYYNKHARNLLEQANPRVENHFSYYAVLLKDEGEQLQRANSKLCFNTSHNKKSSVVSLQKLKAMA